eukprot:COSAG05_NODE_23762_length_256_cov_0.267516_1_plen_28_part_10
MLATAPLPGWQRIAWRNDRQIVRTLGRH